MHSKNRTVFGSGLAQSERHGLARLVCMLTMLAIACSDGPYETVAGRPYRQDAVAALPMGSSVAVIRSTVGVPASVTRREGGYEEGAFAVRTGELSGSHA